MRLSSRASSLAASRVSAVARGSSTMAAIADLSACMPGPRGSTPKNRAFTTTLPNTDALRTTSGLARTVPASRVKNASEPPVIAIVVAAFAQPAGTASASSNRNRRFSTSFADRPFWSANAILVRPISVSVPSNNERSGTLGTHAIPRPTARSAVRSEGYSLPSRASPVILSSNHSVTSGVPHRRSPTASESRGGLPRLRSNSASRKAPRTLPLQSFEVGHASMKICSVTIAWTRIRSEARDPDLWCHLPALLGRKIPR